jgi:hypothetical protein
MSRHMFIQITIRNTETYVDEKLWILILEEDFNRFSAAVKKSKSENAADMFADLRSSGIPMEEIDRFHKFSRK